MAQKNIFQCFCSSSKKKKRSREKTSEKIQPKSNFKRQFMPIILIDFDWCHPRYWSLLKTRNIEEKVDSLTGIWNYSEKLSLSNILCSIVLFIWKFWLMKISIWLFEFVAQESMTWVSDAWEIPVWLTNQRLSFRYWIIICSNYL